MDYKNKLCPSGMYVSDSDCEYCGQCRDYNYVEDKGKEDDNNEQ